MFDNTYQNRRVLVTGHTGFKGSWLCAWLKELGADVAGIALPPPTNPNHFELLDLSITHRLVDIRDAEAVTGFVAEYQPEIIFHLAAQPLVRQSYQSPSETFSTNVIGTQNVYEAALSCDKVSAIVSVTSDKVYYNRESSTGYRETDRLGGSDPYSCSKACAELLTQCYRESFFETQNENRRPLWVATARAGNVIGGGDWAADRIVADIARAAASGDVTRIRNPRAVRPWQHVLESLAGYLIVGQRLMAGESEVARGWNFGPDAESTVDVGTLATMFADAWPDVRLEINPESSAPHETKILTLNSDAARQAFDWRPVWTFQQTVQRVASWYRAFCEDGSINTGKDLLAYTDGAAKAGLAWATATAGADS